MSSFRDDSFLSSNGKTNIHVRRCTPEGEIVGVVQLAHGIAEHVERYDGFAEFLAQHGFLVVANDHLGHGRSVPKEERGFFADKDGWELVCRDIARLSQLEHEKYPGVKYYLLGHSMGSFAARTVFMKNMINADGYIFSDDK